jgi:hypothetical protein
MTRRTLADAIARRLQLVGDADAYFRQFGLAVEETADIKTVLRVADEAYATVREQAW